MNIENYYYVPKLFIKLGDHWIFKSLIGYLLAVASFFFNTVRYEAIFALLALIIVDFLTGLYVAKKTGEPIESGKALRTAIKIVIYMTMISAGHLTEKALGFNAGLDELITGFLAVTELISILEHAAEVGSAVPRQLLNKLKAYTHGK